MIADKLLADPNFISKNGLLVHNGFVNNDFDSTYIDLRKKEGRMFSNEAISKLPDVDESHPHSKEWQIRKRSSQRLINYLNRNQLQKIILEVGCGNGWLSHQLSQIPNSQVIGLDVNAVELQQAAQVFHERRNVTFVMGDLFAINLPFSLDYIILASSIQYFPNLKQLLNSLLSKIVHHGEIHILDTPFYDQRTVDDARDRSKKYFDSQHSKMAAQYHHHTWDELQQFNIDVLRNPSGVVSKLKNRIYDDSPFPWIKIVRE